MRGQRSTGRTATEVVDSAASTQISVPRGTGVVMGEIDLVRQRELRQNFPCVDHRRLVP